MKITKADCPNEVKQAYVDIDVMIEIDPIQGSLIIVDDVNEEWRDRWLLQKGGKFARLPRLEVV